MLRFSFTNKPPSGLLGKETVQLNESRSLMLEHAVIDRIGRSHNLIKRRPITICRPHLIAIFLILAEPLVVLDQIFETPSRDNRIDSAELSMESIEKDLECRQALLSVDNHPLLKLASSALNLLQDDRSEKVWLVFGLRILQ
jgi:hypothetical protein